MAYAAIAPQAALQATFGDTLEGPLAEIIVRNWVVLFAWYLLGRRTVPTWIARHPADRPAAA